MKKQIVIMGLLIGGMVAATGCGPQRSTRLQLPDLMLTSEMMVESLAGSRFLRERTPDSSEVIVVIDKVQNLTSDIIPEAEQWLWVSRVVNQLPMTELQRNRNISFVITPERQQMLRDAGFEAPLQEAPPEPTHALYATFLSGTRGARLKSGVTDERADLYYLEYQLTHVRSRTIEWSDRFEFVREASGKLID